MQNTQLLMHVPAIPELDPPILLDRVVEVLAVQISPLSDLRPLSQKKRSTTAKYDYDSG